MRIFKNLKPIVGPAQVYSDALNNKKFLKTNKFLVILSDWEINKNLLEILLKINQYLKI